MIGDFTFTFYLCLSFDCRQSFLVVFDNEDLDTYVGVVVLVLLKFGVVD